VTATGLLAGLLGAAIISITATLLMPFCGNNYTITGLISLGWDPRSKIIFALAMTMTGLCGSLIDSLLGATLQASVIDVRSGKIVEGEGGRKVLVHDMSKAHLKKSRGDGGTESRRIEVGLDILSNNAVNLIMAAITSVSAMLVAAWFWNVPLREVVFMAGKRVSQMKTDKTMGYRIPTGIKGS
jgi:uncharacterized membrane protein